MVENANDINQIAERHVSIEMRDSSGRWAPGHGPIGGRPKGSVGKITKTLRGELVSGFGGARGIRRFVRSLVIGHPQAAAGLLARMMPPGGLDLEDGGGGGVEITIAAIPSDHSVCPDGKTRPNDEAEPLWAEHNKRLGRDARLDDTAALQVEPEVAKAIARIAQRKADDEGGDA
jgi:hypothetical protein